MELPKSPRQLSHYPFPRRCQCSVRCVTRMASGEVYKISTSMQNSWQPGFPDNLVNPASPLSLPEAAPQMWKSLVHEDNRRMLKAIWKTYRLH